MRLCGLCTLFMVLAIMAPESAIGSRPGRADHLLKGQFLSMPTDPAAAHPHTAIDGPPTSIAVKPMVTHREGLGSILQHHRKSLSYALALKLPWIGTLVNEHDGIDYTKYLGLCQPFCGTNVSSFNVKEVSVTETDLDACMTDGTFKIPEGITSPTVLLVSEAFPGRGRWTADLDEGHTKCLRGLKERMLTHSLHSLRCPPKPYMTFHFRWGDTQTGDYDNPGERTLGMNHAVGLINQILQICSLDVKVLSEGQGVGDAFSKRFRGNFEYVDGFQSALAYDLQVLACSSVVLGGISSFTVLGALLSQGVTIAPSWSPKYHGLNNVLDTSLPAGPDLQQALNGMTPGLCNSVANTARNAPRPM